MDAEKLNVRVSTVVQILVIPILIYGASKLDKMSDDVQELNTKIAVVLNDNTSTKDKIKDMETRLRVLETKGGR